MRRHGAGKGHRSGFVIVGVSCGLLFSLDILAQTEPSESVPTNVISDEGMNAYNSGRYDEANAKFEQTLELNGVPTLALYAARTNVKLGRWVRAMEWYALAIPRQTTSGSEIARMQIEHEALKERLALLGRMPTLTIFLEGQDLEDVKISLDNEIQPDTLLGTGQLVDPGRHVVSAVRGGQVVSGDVDILEGQHKIVKIRFSKSVSMGANEQTLPSLFTSTVDSIETQKSASKQRNSNSRQRSSWTVTTESDSFERKPSDFQKTAGWIGIGLGTVGYLVGTVAFFSLLSTRSQLSDDCVNSHCDASVARQVDYYNSLRTWTTSGYVAGTVFAGVGLTLLLTTPQHRNGTTSRVVLSPNGATYLRQF
jgi:hypothetical protein